MKKALLTLAIAFLGAVTGFAQTHEFAPVGAEWNYSYQNHWVDGFVQIKSVSDTVIEDHSCRKLEKYYHCFEYLFGTYYENLIGNEYVCQVEDVVMLYQNGQFHILYDFGANIGDTWIIPGKEIPCEQTYGTTQVVGTGTENVNGHTLRYVLVLDAPESYWGYGHSLMQASNPDTIKIVESIGPIGTYLLPEQRCEYDYNEGGPLRCYWDETIGHVSYYSNNCDYINTEYQDVEELPEDDAVVFCPNPASTWAVVDYKLPADKTEAVVEIYNSLGAKVMSVELVGSQGQRVLDFRHLPGGVYTYNLRSGEFVKTGKIVITTVH